MLFVLSFVQAWVEEQRLWPTTSASDPIRRTLLIRTAWEALPPCERRLYDQMAALERTKRDAEMYQDGLNQIRRQQFRRRMRENIKRRHRVAGDKLEKEGTEDSTSTST